MPSELVDAIHDWIEKLENNWSQPKTDAEISAYALLWKVLREDRKVKDGETKY